MNYQRVIVAGLLTVFAQSIFSQVIPLDTAVHTGVLSNGFTYYIRHNEEPKDRVLLYLVNKVGSILEDEDQQGLAHFMEHMNFNGTKHFPKNQLVDYLQKSGVRFGADLNAYTGFDETVYQLPLPTNDASLLQNGFQIMRDWAADASLDSIEIEKERGVVLEEKRLAKGAGERMQRQYFPSILNHSRYADRLPIGQEEILNNFKPETIRRFYHEWYRPDLQALIVVGDVDVVQTEMLVKKMFGDIINPANERQRKKYAIDLTGHNQFIEVTDKEMSSTEMQIIIKHKDEELVTELDYINSMKHQLFNQMVAGRFAELSQQPNLPFVNASAGIGGFLGGLDNFSFSVDAKQGQLKGGFEKAWEEIERIKKFGFAGTELDRAKQNYLRGMEASYKEKNKTNSLSMVGEYQRLFLNHESSPGIAWEYDFVKNKIGSISLDDINAITKEYIKSTDRDILILAPEKEKSDLPDSLTVSNWLDEVSNKNLAAYKDETNVQPLIDKKLIAGKIISEKKIEAIGVTELRLSNGVKIILKPTDFKNDEIRFTAFSPGGTSLYDDKDFQSSANAAGIISSFGVGNFDAIALNKKLTGKQASVAPYIAERSQGINGYAAPQDLETALQLVQLYFTSPRKDTALFNNIISNSKDALSNRYSDPNNVFRDTINYLLGNYNYRRAAPSVERLLQINLDKSYSIYKERFADASNFTFLFVGSFDIDSIRPLLETYLASLPSQHSNEAAKDLHIHIPRGQIVKKVFKGSENKANVRMVFSGDYKFSPSINIQLRALSEVLQIKVLEHLREDESEVYSPSVQVFYGKYPTSSYVFNVSFGCAPKNADHLMGDVVKEITALQKNGAALQDVEKFKAEYKRTHELQLRSNSFWLSYLSNQYENKENPLQVQSQESLLDKVKPTSIQKTAIKYLNGNNRIEFVLLPENQ